MIRAILNDDRGPTLVLGLSRENTRRLLNGQPIHFDLGQMGYQLQPVAPEPRDNGSRVLVLAGETEQDIGRALGFATARQPKPGESTHVFRERG